MAKTTIQSNVYVTLSTGSEIYFEIPEGHESLGWMMESGRLKVVGNRKADNGNLIAGLTLGEFPNGAWLAVRREA